MVGSSEGSPLRGTYFRMTTNARGSGVFDDWTRRHIKQHRHAIFGTFIAEDRTKNNSGDKEGNTLGYIERQASLQKTVTVKSGLRDGLELGCEVQGRHRQSTIDDKEAAESEGKTVETLIRLQRILSRYDDTLGLEEDATA
ncbi:hypothetical protein ARMGADRAFT_1107076 [Armillaria gallica]|uniref:Uncharacterized protein n=1 Tax=Armillaria gallica TaxID=47427 RepID=A0A2H3DSB0_ARMGA|nr:hypothetical protein ARMGADRAFT_1107076 [Armillaria gallica]